MLLVPVIDTIIWSRWPSVPANLNDLVLVCGNELEENQKQGEVNQRTHVAFSASAAKGRGRSVAVISGCGKHCSALLVQAAREVSSTSSREKEEAEDQEDRGRLQSTCPSIDQRVGSTM
jgi:chemotaxis signal transduction protein